MKNIIIKQTLHTLKKYNIHDIKISWIKSNRHIFGEACYQRRFINYNENLLRQEQGEIKFTILHEISHIVANKLHGYNCDHDKNWRTIANYIFNHNNINLIQ